MNQHEQKIKTLIPIAEATGDSRRAAYQAIAEEIAAWMEEDSTLTQAAVAQRIGKTQRWVSTLSKALIRARIEGGDFVLDWNSGKHTEVPARQENRVKLAAELLAQPGIAEAVMRSQTPAAREMRRVVSVANYENAQGAATAREARRNDGMVPIDGHYARIAQKLGAWTDELVGIKEDLVEAPETIGKRMVMIALRSLGDVAHGIANEIDPDLSNVFEVR